MFDNINIEELKQLDIRAYELQKYIDQYENAVVLA